MTEYGFDPIFFVIPCPLPPLLSLQALKETIREKNGHSVICGVDVQAFEFVLKAKNKYDLIIIDIFEDTNMPNFLFEDFFINRINFLLKPDGFILFNTMVINDKDKIRNMKYKKKFNGNYSLRMYPKVEDHNELFTIKKLG